MAPINQKELRRFLYRVGFMHAMSWTEKKLRTMAVDFAKHGKEEDVPEVFKDLFYQLKKYQRTGAYMDWAPPQRKEKNV